MFAVLILTLVILAVLILVVGGLTLFMLVASVGVWFDGVSIGEKLYACFTCLLSVIVGSMGLTLGALNFMMLWEVL